MNTTHDPLDPINCDFCGERAATPMCDCCAEADEHGVLAAYLRGEVPCPACVLA
jgi:hypothetical protein